MHEKKEKKKEKKKRQVGTDTSLSVGNKEDINHLLYNLLFTDYIGICLSIID